MPVSEQLEPGGLSRPGAAIRRNDSNTLDTVLCRTNIHSGSQPVRGESSLRSYFAHRGSRQGSKRATAVPVKNSPREHLDFVGGMAWPLPWSNLA